MLSFNDNIDTLIYRSIPLICIVVFTAIMLILLPLAFTAADVKPANTPPSTVKYKIDSSAVPFDGDSAKKFVETLCCPEFAGRKSGDPEAALAEKWIADKFAEFGLEPGGTKGCLQPFPILNNRELKAELKLLNGRHGGKNYQTGEDFHLITNSGSGKIKAEVVFVGYGISEPEMEHDEYEGIDVKGKIVLISRGTPRPERDWQAMRWRDYKLNIAVAKGAAGVIFCGRERSISGAAIHLEAFHSEIPVLMISQHVADDIFRGSGRRYSDTAEKLNLGIQSFNTGKVMRIVTRLKHNPAASAANVIGVLPGSDPRLKEEWLIIGGHLDHNGVNAVSDTFFGADDNASGVSVVMELARGFASLEKPVKRSLMFIAFAGEEQGLLGSKHFVDHPTIELEKAAAMFNYDCCGLGEGKPRIGGAEHFPAIWEQYLETLSENDRNTLSISRHWRYGSDNHYFQEWGTPTFNLSSVGKRLFYHLQEDIPPYIPAGMLESMGKASGNFIHFLADWNEPLTNQDYRARTRLYSAYTINLETEPVPPSPKETPKLAEELKERWRRGLKCQLVEISHSSAEADWEFWYRMCREQDFIWAPEAKGVRNAYNKKKLALTPALRGAEGIDPEGFELDRLNLLGVKLLLLENTNIDCVTAIDLLKKTADLGMLLIYSQGFQWNEAIHPGTKRVEIVQSDVICPRVMEMEGDDNLRLAVLGEFPDLSFGGSDKLERYLHLNLEFSRETELENALKHIGNMEKQGFSPEDIGYILGGNLLEVIP